MYKIGDAVYMPDGRVRFVTKVIVVNRPIEESLEQLKARRKLKLPPAMIGYTVILT